MNYGSNINFTGKTEYNLIHLFTHFESLIHKPLNGTFVNLPDAHSVLSSLGPLLLIQCLLEFVFLYFFLLLLLILYRYVLSFFPSYHWMHLHNLIWYILWRSILKWSYNISSAYNFIYDQQMILQQSCITSYTLIHSFDRSKFN